MRGIGMKKLNRLTLEDIRKADGKPTAGIMNLKGKDLYVETYGQIEKPAIAFLHGGPGTSCVEQREMSELLAQRYFVVSFDQYGVFRSGDIGEKERFGMKEHINQMEQLRETLHIEKWTLLGHSYGGMLVCYYTYLYPNSIEASIYENPGWCFTKNVKTIASYYLDKYYSIHPDEIEGMNYAKKIIEKEYTGHERESVSDILKAQSYVKDLRVTMYMHSIEPERYFSCFEKCYKELGVDEKTVDQKAMVHLNKLIEAGDMFIDHRPELKVNQNPALLINGRYDPVCDAEDRQYFIENAPHGKVVILEKSAHHPRLEQTEEYLQAIFEFMDEYGIR